MPSGLDRKVIEQLARDTGFVQRRSRLDAYSFLNSLMFSHQQGKDLSLLDLCCDLYTHNNLLIKKQSLHNRFGPKAVAFFHAVLSRLLESRLEKAVAEQLSTYFGRVRIKDSTRFALPSAFSNVYKGHCGVTHNSASMISIQYEYDLCSGTTMDLRLTTGVRNDQLDARENTHNIEKSDLFIRDLGYSTTVYMQEISDNGAYFLNRLNPNMAALHADGSLKEVDFEECQKKLKRYGLPYLEYQVFIGKEAKVPCRMIIYRVNQSTYEKRLRKRSKQAKSYGHQVTDLWKSKAWLSMYITNTTEAMIPADKIKSIYGLRWQIELTFKIWKSQGKIDEVKKMKIHRFECQLLARLICLLTHMKIYRWLKRSHDKTYPGQTLSIWKYYKHAYRINYLLREIINVPNKLRELLKDLLIMAKLFLLLEIKKGQKSHYQVMTDLN